MGNSRKQYTNATGKLYGIAKFVLYNYKTPLLRAGQELASDPSASPSTIQQLYGLAVIPLKHIKTFWMKVYKVVNFI